MGQRDAARQFATDWNGRGNEDAHSQSFWLDLLRDVFGVEKSSSFIEFEKSVSFGGYTHKIDGYISKTKVLIEQKSYSKNLTDKYQQSDGILLTPFEQALRYAENLDYGERPRWIVTCNFAEFRIYYAQKFFFHYEIAPPVIVKLENLPDEYDRLKFLVDPDDTTILDDVNFSKAALEVIKNFYIELVARYIKFPVDGWHEYIYKICVRLVFCFYADDSRLFNEQKYFAPYLQNFKGTEQINALQNIFGVLNTPTKLRGNIDKDLNEFPYVNGGMFDEFIILPNFEGLFTTPIDAVFLANTTIHWEKISPPIFGAMFESVLDPDIRRQRGMHYTSEENIHKVIDPLFLDKLKEDFKAAKGANKKNRLQKLRDFQNELASLTFFDPACGSGNFLTETYLSIRALENETIRAIYDIGGKNLFDEEPIKVSINNFFGIEIHAYAVAVAKLAMWIAEHQMLHKTEKILHKNLNPLPLKNYPNIKCANALQVDWADFVPRDKLSYIIGNPPFVGTKYQTPAQKFDLLNLCKNLKPLDYVTGWYYKASEFIQGTKIECAFVSTNSITQGEQVAPLWKNLPVKINFARRTFKWISDSDDMAAVHCVIISFAVKSRRKKIIYDGDKEILAKNINGYLFDAPNIYIEKRKLPLQNFVPQIFMGSTMVDDDNLKFSAYGMQNFLEKEPAAKNFFRPLIGSEEFIKGKKRFCLWLKDFSLEEIKNFPKVFERVEAVKNFRKKSNREGTRKGAENPQNFLEIRQPETDYILIPKVSSENRRYIPIGFLDENYIAVNTALIIPDANLFHFGILNSSIHNSWMRAVGGRLEMRYQYSATIIYNNFVWCEPTAENVEKITKTAAKILSVRAEFEGKTLAWLYNETTMPKELRLAHLENDAAVMAAYGFDENLSESEIVAELMKMYKSWTSD